MKNAKQDNLQSVQFLRGIAAFMVFLHHWAAAKELPDTNYIKQVCGYGWMGVNVFFIISGFIIPYSMFLKDYKIGDFKSFFVRRVVRIEPPYIISIVLVLLLAYITTLSGWYKGPAFTIDWGNVLGHIGYVNVFTGRPWLNQAYWTLAIEFEYYFLIALLYPLITSADKRILVGTYCALLAATFLPVPQVHIIYYLPFFLMGIALFLYKAGRIKAGLFFPMIIAAMIVSGYVHGAVLFVLSVISLLCIQYIKKVGTAFLWLGTISYSLYLTHGPLTGRFMLLAEKYMGGSPSWIRLGLCIVFCLVFAYIYYLVIEKPFLALSKKVKFSHPNSKPV